MVRRYATYPARFQALNVVSTVGSWALGAGLLLTVVYLLRTLLGPRNAAPNAWDSLGLEWDTATPPPLHNFISRPTTGA